MKPLPPTKIPSVCSSSKDKDKAACEAWKRANDFSIYQQPSSKMSPKTEKLNPMKFNYQQQPNIINGGMPTFIANPYEQYVNCGNKNLSAEMIKACESFRKNNPNEYFKLSYGPSPIDERLANCEMSVEGKEITCGDDVYVLSRKVSDTSREIIKSIESNGTSKTSAPGAKIE